MTTLLLGALALILSVQPMAAQVEASVSIGGFYDELAPYGRWVDCSYGQCWVPERVAADWQPYTNGQWAYTDYGWTWMSDDPWGGNPYHYGTWTSLDRYGWSWVPGTVWAPAWVTWSFGNNYVGWAPLPPNVAFGSSGYAGSAVVVSPTQYVFVPMNRFVGANVTSVRVAVGQNETIFRKTTPVTRFEVSGGIVRNTAFPVATIERGGNVKITTRSIGDAHATPRSMTAGVAGTSRQVAIVATASEVKAAVAARPHSVSRPAATSEEKEPKPNVNQESRRERPLSQQGATAQSVPVKPEQREQEAQKAHKAQKPDEASPAEPKAQTAQASAQARQESSNAPRRPEVSVAEPRHEAAPAQHEEPHAQAEASQHAANAPAQAAQPAKIKQGEQEKPVEKDKDKSDKDKNDKDKNEEKH